MEYLDKAPPYLMDGDGAKNNKDRLTSRLPEELDYRFHLSSREDLLVGLVSHGGQGIPQAACEVHLLAEELDGTALTSVGIV